MKALVIYHAPHCNDGYTAAWVAYHGIKSLSSDSTVALYPMGYGKEEEELLLDHLVIETYDWIYVVDFSLRLVVIDKVLCYQPDLMGMTILDHHKTAFEMYAPGHKVTPRSVLKLSILEAKVHIILHNGMSGAALAWYHWNSGNMPPLVAHVQDRDLWRFELEHTKAIHMYLQEKEFTIENWDRIARELDSPGSYTLIVGVGNELLEMYNKEVEAIVDEAESCIIRGETGLMVECNGKYASNVGNVLAKTCGTFGLTYSESEDGEKLHCSLRSNNDYDVEVIAKKFGGGGHKNAAGFVIDIEEMHTTFEEKQGEL